MNTFRNLTQIEQFWGRGAQFKTSEDLPLSVSAAKLMRVDVFRRVIANMLNDPQLEHDGLQPHLAYRLIELDIEMYRRDEEVGSMTPSGAGLWPDASLLIWLPTQAHATEPAVAVELARLGASSTLEAVGLRFAQDALQNNHGGDGSLKPVILGARLKDVPNPQNNTSGAVLDLHSLDELSIPATTMATFKSINSKLLAHLSDELLKEVGERIWGHDPEYQPDQISWTDGIAAREPATLLAMDDEA